MDPLLFGRLITLAVLDRWAASAGDGERGDGGPVPTAVTVAAVLTASLLVVAAIARVVQKYVGHIH